MPKAQMTGHERIKAAIKHEAPDRVPIAPRMDAWLCSEFGTNDLAAHFKAFPDMNPMFILYDTQPNYFDTYPDTYHLPDVKVEQQKYQENAFIVVKRKFHTPAGVLSDCTKIPPTGGEYGVSPNPLRTEHLIKSASDLPALQYLLPRVNANYDALHQHRQMMGDRGVVMVCIRSALDHHAGNVRDLQDLMLDYYDNRPFFNALLALFHQYSLHQHKAALEGGADFIFGSWYYHSLSSGWSPAIFREVFIPQLKEHVELTHSYEAYYDYYDDGHLNQTMEMIAATGIDVLETCTPPPVGDFDLARAKDLIGAQTTIKGYIDLLYVVKNGTPALIEETVRNAMEIAKPGGGFIIGSSDSFREGTPRENIRAYFEACLKYGS